MYYLDHLQIDLDHSDPTLTLGGEMCRICIVLVRKHVSLGSCRFEGSHPAT